jgi:hypothetical protein
MKKLPLALLLFLSVNLFSQDLSKKIDFKLYTNFDYTPKYLYNDSDTLREYEREINGFNFSPALVFNTQSGNSSEIEISRFRFSNIYNKEYSTINSTGAVEDIISGDYKKQFELFLRYEYKIGLLKKKGWERFKPVIGFSATPYIKWNKNIPGLSNTFSTSRTTVGLFMSVIPRIEYKLNDKWYLDLNIPLSVLTMDFITNKADNPNLPIEERTVHTVEFYNGPIAVAVRFGVGYMIK